MCISWNNKKCFDTVDARCKHEDPMPTFMSRAADANSGNLGSLVPTS